MLINNYYSRKWKTAFAEQKGTPPLASDISAPPATCSFPPDLSFLLPSHWRRNGNRSRPWGHKGRNNLALTGSSCAVPEPQKSCGALESGSESSVLVEGFEHKYKGN